MQSTDRVLAVIGLGLFMDRYATSRGTYSKTGTGQRQVTLIHAEQIAEANRLAREPYLPSETRRNLIVAGDVNLIELIGRPFTIGHVEFFGSEECLPCLIPGRLYGKDDFVRTFAGRGGIRAEVRSTGYIHVNDRISLPSEAAFESRVADLQVFRS